MPLSEIAPRAPQTAVVPAAGWGTRLRPLSDTLPKELLPLGRRVVLEHILVELATAGLSRVVFVVSPAKESLIRSRFGSKSEGLCIEYALQAEMRGLGDAVLQTAPLLSGESGFFVALGDAVFIEAEPGAIARRLLIGSEPIAIAVQKVAPEKLSRYGVVKPLKVAEATRFSINGIVEKPTLEEAPSNFAVAARYRLPAEIFDTLRTIAPEAGGEIYLTGAIAALLAAGIPGVAVPLQPGEARHDIGNFETYWRAFVTFALADPEHGDSLRRFLEEVNP
ncbi:MAG: sugar phosphate nucleotidyltransferase [Armatimonas sp.]